MATFTSRKPLFKPKVTSPAYYDIKYPINLIPILDLSHQLEIYLYIIRDIKMKFIKN